VSVIERTIQCTTCRGSGVVESDDSTDDCIYKCWACDGTGKIADRRKPDPALQGAVSRIDAALKIIEAERAADGNLQMGRAKASQVIELLRSAGGQ
jgi:hypothetical protein